MPRTRSEGEVFTQKNASTGLKFSLDMLEDHAGANEVVRKEPMRQSLWEGSHSDPGLAFQDESFQSLPWDQLDDETSFFKRKAEKNLRLIHARGVNPDEEANRELLASRGIFPEDLQEVKTAKQREEFSMQDAPIEVTKYFADLSNAGVSSDDGVQLSILSNAIKYVNANMDSVGSSWKQGQAQVAAVSVYLPILASVLSSGKITKKQTKKIKEFYNRWGVALKEKPNEDSGLIGDVGSFIAKGLPEELYSLSESSGEIVVGALSGGAVGTLVPAVGNVVGATAGGVAGWRAGSMKATFYIEASNTFREFLLLKDENGQPLDPRLAAASAIVVGTICGGSQVVGGNTILKVVPGLKKFSTSALKQGLRKVLKNPKAQEVVFDLIKEGASAVGNKVIQDKFKQVVKFLGTEVVKVISDNNAGTSFDSESPEKTPFKVVGKSAFSIDANQNIGSGDTDLLDRQEFTGKAPRKHELAEMDSSLIDPMGYGSLGLTVVTPEMLELNRGETYEKDQALHERAKLFKALIDQTKTQSRSPQKMRLFLEGNGIDEEVFWGVDGIGELFQSDRESAVKLVKKLGLDLIDVERNVKDGIDVPIRMADLYTNTNPDQFGEIVERLTTVPGGFSREQIQQLDTLKEKRNLQVEKKHSELHKEFDRLWRENGEDDSLYHQLSPVARRLYGSDTSSIIEFMRTQSLLAEGRGAEPGQNPTGMEDRFASSLESSTMNSEVKAPPASMDEEVALDNFGEGVNLPSFKVDFSTPSSLANKPLHEDSIGSSSLETKYVR